ncbi:MAG: right-handed parallel beta-helix repeat-containing protein [Blastocatellia bacterium]|nr:right-handed parallel beta-helix repeat-containing protein [Blastocatellia bacterium]
MQPLARVGAYLFLCFLSLILNVDRAFGQTNDQRYYDIGNPTVTDIYLDPTNGNDGNDGSSRTAALKTLKVAWDKIPADTQLTNGYRINILPGIVPCPSNCNNYLAQKYGTAQFPIIITAADGRGTATIQGGLNVFKVNYLYLMDLNIEAGNGVGTFSNDVLHFEQVYNLLMRGLKVTGLNPAEFQEVIKANQCQNVYLEDSEVSGCGSTGVDFFAVQWGHIVNNRIHNAGTYGMYLKGGSGYFRVEANEIYNTQFGFGAGEGSNISYLVPPYFHYEVYDVKFVNNVMHDIPGTGIAVSGGYNILLAYNTLYKVAYSQAPTYGILTLDYGIRVCNDATGVTCKQMTDQGAWGSSTAQDPSVSYDIPNRNVFIYNNIIYNPAPLQTTYGDFVIYGPKPRPAGFVNLPDTLATDQNLQIKGNVIWNGPGNQQLGIELPDRGCQATNPTCNAAQLQTDNTINVVEPKLLNPDNGDFHLSPDANLANAKTFAIPDFTWDEPVVAGNLSNAIMEDRDWKARAQANPQGAYTLP